MKKKVQEKRQKIFTKMFTEVIFIFKFFEVNRLLLLSLSLSLSLKELFLPSKQNTSGPRVGGSLMRLAKAIYYLNGSLESHGDQRP